MNDDVKKLAEIASDTLKQHKIERLRKKLTERAQEIKDAPPSQMMDFYCSTCEKDFGGLGFKQVCIPKVSVWFAWYETPCPEGHICLRYITDKIADPYFVQSPFVRAQQVEFEDSMVGPDNPRFKVLYPEAWKKIQSQKFEREFTNN